MDLKKEYPVDGKKVRDGVWKNIRGGEFKLTYYDSTVSQISFQSNIKRKKAEAYETDGSAVIAAMRQTIVDEIVLEFRNIEEDGIEVAYSKKELARILDEYEGLDMDIMKASEEIEAFKRKNTEETLEN